MTGTRRWASQVARVVAAVSAFALSGFLPAQTTQGIISGRVVDRLTNLPLPGARVECTHVATERKTFAETDARGRYALPLLSPGEYKVTAGIKGYQNQETHGQELPVASRIELDFSLRPIGDLWDEKSSRYTYTRNERVVHFYAGDARTLRPLNVELLDPRSTSLYSTVSYVISTRELASLPLAGRDAYALLSLLPGVTADNAAARGLGLSINGQRPSSSNFLLDGLENNNSLVSGPLTAIAPEALQEYRVSTHNFSAEYGRTSGAVANAVTRGGGGTKWHGQTYSYLKNEALNAGDFALNARGVPRLPAREYQLGTVLGGPIAARRLFVSGAFEGLRSRASEEPAELALPPAGFALGTLSPLARQLITSYAAPYPASTASAGRPATVRIAQPVSVDRYLSLQRIDYRPPTSRHQLLGRLSLARQARPDFVWSPYRDFVSGLTHNSFSAAFNAQSALSPRLSNEARFGWGGDDLRWDRAHPEIPTLLSGDGTLLPGNPASSAYGNRGRNWEFVENLSWFRGRHILKAGGGLLLHRLSGYLTALRDGRYFFNNLADFGRDESVGFGVVLDRPSLPARRLPAYDRVHRQNQFFLFAEDAWRLAPRVMMNLGVRYESFGAPRNVGAAKDAVLELGQGPDFPRRLAGRPATVPGPGPQSLYQPDRNDWAARFGFSVDLSGRGSTLLRGAYGVFYDRPFDNLWWNVIANRFVQADIVHDPVKTNYLEPVSVALSRYPDEPFATNSPNLTLIDPGLRTTYVQTILLGVQHAAANSWSLETTAVGTLGRKLLTTDVVNRGSAYNRQLPQVSYRGNQGSSDYFALTALARYRGWSRGQFQIAYTWSHAIDNQSDALAGEFLDLYFTRPVQGAGPGTRAGFAREFDSRGDRGNSDFDQRQNLVFFSIWELPAPFSTTRARALFKNWRFSQLAALRSGFPYSVTVSGTPNNRADVVDPERVYAAGSPAAPGGRVLLNAAAFAAPASGRVGNGGRGALRGPGFLSADISLCRWFPLRRLGESGRLLLRADAINFLNHANLGNPDSHLTSSTFGIASFGRQGRDLGFPSLTPFNESARQIQLMLRLEF